MINDYNDVFQSVGSQYGIDPDLLKAQAMAESSGDPDAVGPATSQGQAQGISQIMPATAKSMGVDPTDPRAAIDAQARLLKANLAQFGTPENAVLAYHGGTNQDNWGPKTQAYLKKVSANYQQLKSAANNNAPPAVEPQDDFEREALGQGAAKSTPAVEPQDDFEREALAAAPEKAPAVGSQVPAPVAPSAVPSADVGTGPFTDAQAAARRSEVAYGLGDIPRSVANVVAQIAPKTYGSLVGAVNDSLGATLPTTPPDLKNDLDSRNSQYQSQYGSDPDAPSNRLVGQVLGSMPALGAMSKAAGAVGSAATRLSPTLAQWAAQSRVASFLGGSVASNAVVDPATGAVVKGATLGNKLGQYAASGLRGAELAAPITALTNAGSDAPVSKQLAQNAAGGAVLGAAAPAAYDLGTGAVNSLRSLVSGPSGVEQKATSVLNELAGGSLGKLDTTEYVPGSKPTLAQAAVENPNVAALDRTLKEGNPAAGELTIPELTNAERQQDTARRSYLDTITGSPQDLETAKDARSAAANLLLYGHPDGEAAAAVNKLQPSVWDTAQPANVQPVVDKIDSILKGPDRKNDAVQSALGDIKNKLVNSDGTLESDPETLYRSVIKDINTKLDKANPLDQASQNVQAAAVQVRKVKDALNSTLSDATKDPVTGASGYKNYLSTYSKLSQPIDEMNVLQNKLNFLNQPSDEGVPTLAKVNKALDTITKQKSASGFSPYDSVSPDTVNKLQNLQKDLARADNPNKLLRITGSPTDPKIAARKKVEELLSSKVKPVLQWAGASAGGAGGAMLGEHLGGPWTAAIGAGMGEESGRRLGGSVGDFLAASKADVTNHLTKLMLSPGAAQQAASRAVPQLRSFGQLPQAQNALSYAAPFLATKQNQARSLNSQ